MINVFVGSMKAESVAASRIEQTLSEVASSYNSNFQPRPGSHQTWLLQAQIWLHLGRYQSLTATPHPQKNLVATGTNMTSFWVGINLFLVPPVVLA